MSHQGKALRLAEQENAARLWWVVGVRHPPALRVSDFGSALLRGIFFVREHWLNLDSGHFETP